MDIKPGDRVRAKTSCEGYGVVDVFFKASGEPGTMDALTVSWDNGMRSGIAVASVNLVFRCYECENENPLPYIGGDDDHPVCGYCMSTAIREGRRG